MTDVLTPRVVAATATTSTTAAAGHHLPVDATSAPVTITLPSAVNQGAYLSVTKVDAGTNTVTISGTIHGGSSTVTLTSQYETLTFTWLGATWEPLEGHRTKTAIDAVIDAKIATQATADASSYETQTHAASTYETQTHAAATYATPASVAATSLTVARKQALIFANA